MKKFTLCFFATILIFGMSVSSYAVFSADSSRGIQESVPFSEPAKMFFIGSGLIGLAGLVRKIGKNRNQGKSDNFKI